MFHSNGERGGGRGAGVEGGGGSEFIFLSMYILLILLRLVSSSISNNCPFLLVSYDFFGVKNRPLIFVLTYRQPVV